jgi:hypothetical protein
MFMPSLWIEFLFGNEREKRHEVKSIACFHLDHFVFAILRQYTADAFREIGSR